MVKDEVVGFFEVYDLAKKLFGLNDVVLVVLATFDGRLKRDKRAEVYPAVCAANPKGSSSTIRPRNTNRMHLSMNQLLVKPD